MDNAIAGGPDVRQNVRQSVQVGRMFAKHLQTAVLNFKHLAEPAIVSVFANAYCRTRLAQHKEFIRIFVAISANSDFRDLQIFFRASA
jgi:hypothetical protein